MKLLSILIILLVINITFSLRKRKISILNNKKLKTKVDLNFQACLSVINNTLRPTITFTDFDVMSVSELVAKYKNADHTALFICTQGRLSDAEAAKAYKKSDKKDRFGGGFSSPRPLSFFFLFERDPENMTLLFSYIGSGNNCNDPHALKVARNSIKYYDRKTTEAENKAYNDAKTIATNVATKITSSLTTPFLTQLGWWVGNCLFSIGNVITLGLLTPAQIAFNASVATLQGADIVMKARSLVEVSNSLSETLKHLNHGEDIATVGRHVNGQSTSFRTLLIGANCYIEYLKTAGARNIPLANSYIEYISTSAINNNNFFWQIKNNHLRCKTSY